MDLNQTLRLLFQSLADDSEAAQASGVTSSEGYAILGAERGKGGWLETACVHVPTLIEAISAGLTKAQREYEELVRRTLAERPLPYELIRKSVEQAPPEIPEPMLRTRWEIPSPSPSVTPDDPPIKCPPGWTSVWTREGVGWTIELRHDTQRGRALLNRCGQVTAKDPANPLVCLFSAHDWAHEHGMHHLFVGDSPVCGELHSQAGVPCLLAYPHRPYAHRAPARGAGVFQW